jgi:hypothetical protein
MEAKGIETALMMPFELLSSSFGQIMTIVENFVLLIFKMIGEVFNGNTP